jgi:hypothetical protein
MLTMTALSGINERREKARSNELCKPLGEAPDQCGRRDEGEVPPKRGARPQASRLEGRESAASKRQRRTTTRRLSLASVSLMVARQDVAGKITGACDGFQQFSEAQIQSRGRSSGFFSLFWPVE